MKGSLAVVTPIFPPEPGGPATFSKNFGAHLAGLDADFRVYAKFGAGAGEPWLDCMRLGRGKLANLLERRRVAQCISAHDKVLAVNMELEVLWAQFLRRTPYAIKVPGDPVWEACRARGLTSAALEDFHLHRVWDARIMAHRWLQRKYVAGASAIIAPSHYLAGIVRRQHHPLQKIHIIPNAVHFVLPAEEARRRRSGPRSNRVLWMGRLAETKQPDYAVRLARACPGIQLDIAGSGPLRDDIARQAAALPNVRMLGHVPSSELLAKGGYGVYVNTSLYEGHPHSLIEALGAGLPVCSLPNGGSREVLESQGGGVLSADMGFESFLAAFENLQRNPGALPPVDQDDLRRRHDPRLIFTQLLAVIEGL